MIHIYTSVVMMHRDADAWHLGKLQGVRYYNPNKRARGVGEAFDLYALQARSAQRVRSARSRGLQIEQMPSTEKK